MMTPACEATVKPQVLRLETVGSFTVDKTTDESHRCGLAGSPRTLAFKVEIWSSPEHLDDSGFIIDWQRVHAYFHETYREIEVFPSCELIALRACRDIVGLLGGSCLKIEVTIGSGSRPAGMTAMWQCADFSALIS